MDKDLYRSIFTIATYCAWNGRHARTLMNALIKSRRYSILKSSGMVKSISHPLGTCLIEVSSINENEGCHDIVHKLKKYLQTEVYGFSASMMSNFLSSGGTL